MWAIRTIDEFTLDFSGDFNIQTELSTEGSVTLVSASKKDIRLIAKDEEYGPIEFYISFDQLVDIVEQGRGRLTELQTINFFDTQEWLRLTPAQAMSIGCKWMNYRLKHR